MLQSTPAFPARGGPPKALTGVINTVVGQIKVTTADQLPELTKQSAVGMTESDPAPAVTQHRLTKLETAQLMKDRQEWMMYVDQLSVEDPDAWNAHKEKLKAIVNMTPREKMDLFARFRRIAETHGIAWNETKRLFFKAPVPEANQDL